MKKLFILFFFFTLVFSSNGQRFSSPASGKCIVCFVSIYGGYKYVFHNDSLLTKFEGIAYTIHEVDPGYNLFLIGWPQKEGNKMFGFNEVSFYETNLIEGKIYFFNLLSQGESYGVYVISRYSMIPYNNIDSISHARVKRLLKHVEPKIISDKSRNKHKNLNYRYFRGKMEEFAELKELNDTTRIFTIPTESFTDIEVLNKL